jgi:hypothetical protein
LVSVDQLLGHGGNDLLVKLTADFQELEGGSPGSLRKRVIQASLNYAGRGEESQRAVPWQTTSAPCLRRVNHRTVPLRGATIGSSPVASIAAALQG